MKERPILMSTLMVQAILEGRKTQTRRLLKPQPIREWDHCSPYFMVNDPKREEFYSFGNNLLGDCSYEPVSKIPYYEKQILWVRETWLNDPRGSADGKSPCYYYKADLPNPNIWKGYWKPSIFMPKEACRIRLQVTCVIVEKLQEIKTIDVIAEGLQVAPNSTGIGSYAKLWDDINGKGSWDKNPWVWVITFKKL